MPSVNSIRESTPAPARLFANAERKRDCHVEEEIDRQFEQVRVSGRGDLGAAHVLLSAAGLRVALASTGEQVLYSADDLVGAQVDLLPDHGGCVIRAFAYPFCPGGWLTGKRRERVCVELVLRAGKGELLEVITDGHRWCHAIVRVARGRSPIAADVDRRSPLRRRRFLVYVNPNSGHGQSEGIFRDSVRPMLDEADIEVDLVRTRAAGHARDHVQDANLSGIDCIVIVSGDGLVYEVLNGLMTRADREEAILTPIGAVPTGSGNALVASVLHATKEPYSVVSAVFSLLKGRAAPLDILRLSSAGKTWHSFLSVSWGLVCDVDLESEVFRSLGNVRFLITFVQRIVALRRYQGRFSYLPAHTGEGSCETADDSEGLRCNGKASDSRGMRSLKYTRQDMVEDDSGRSRCNGYSYATPSSQAKSADSIASSHLESSIESTLSDDWVVREGEFIGVLPLTLSHLTSDMLWFEDARLDDGLVHTCIADGNTSRWQVIKKNVLNMACYDSHIVQAKARAFRLEPREGHGKLAVDGEKIDLCSIHGVVLQGKARVMTL